MAEEVTASRGRGRPPVLKSRINTCVSLERNDLKKLKSLNIDLSNLVRNAVKEAVSDEKVYSLKNEAKKLRESIKNETIKLELIEREIELLEEYTEKDNEYSYAKNPINTHFTGLVFHHMHLKIYEYIDHNIGIYIPHEIHRSIVHSSMTGQGIREINKAALTWLCEQAEI